MIDIKKLKRTGAVTLPSLFTIGNMAFGFFATLAAIDMEFSRAGWFVLGAGVLDVLDGKVARLVNGESQFGVEIDSLADFMSFGIAPAYLMYMFALKDYGFWGYPVVFFYTLCSALRLAKFNIMTHDGSAPKKHFSGLPVPAAAGILASFVLTYTLIEFSGDIRSMKFLLHQMPVIYNFIPAIMIGLGLLMVSKIPYAAVKHASLFASTRTIKGIIFIVGLIFLLIAYPRDVIFLFLSAYVIFGILASLWKSFRRLSK
jgi:CDP-diacylglycerol---serine O-phosphatidyltransferase